MARRWTCSGYAARPTSTYVRHAHSCRDHPRATSAQRQRCSLILPAARRACSLILPQVIQLRRASQPVGALTLRTVTLRLEGTAEQLAAAQAALKQTLEAAAAAAAANQPQRRGLVSAARSRGAAPKAAALKAAAGGQGRASAQQQVFVPQYAIGELIGKKVRDSQSCGAGRCALRCAAHSGGGGTQCGTVLLLLRCWPCHD
eukprot:COSAG01_NODE_3233_length_6376_cov_6.983750_4_plen_202_part_00